MEAIIKDIVINQFVLFIMNEIETGATILYRATKDERHITTLCQRLGITVMDLGQLEKRKSHLIGNRVELETNGSDVTIIRRIG